MLLQPQHTALVLLAVCLCVLTAEAQPLRFPSVERRNDVVVLLADVATGRLLGGVRTNEATNSRYCPGSVFKLAIAVAALRTGSMASTDTFTCRGHATFAGIEHRCWLDAGHGVMRLVPAIARSCNLYFRHAAATLDRDALIAAARDLGMISDESPSVTIDDRTLLGESFAVNPSDMLRAALTLASRGRLSAGRLDLSSPRYRPLYQGLRGCVTSGTARSAWSRRYTLGGKTGTAERPESPRRRAGWFIGFAPFERPRYAIVVLHRKGMGSDAASVARQILTSLF